MRCKIVTARNLLICGLIATTTASSGCKSGWKMPGASMFSWGKKPSEETLAGKGPTTTLPTSPATTQTPSLLAGAGSKTTQAKPSPYATATRPTSPGSPVTASLASGNVQAPTAWPSANPNQAPAGMGTAATANGYTTGPYNTYAQSNPYASAGTTYGTAAQTAPNAMAANYGAPNVSMPPATQPGYGIQSANSTGLQARTVSSPINSATAATNPAFTAPQQQQFAQPSAMPNAVPSSSFAMPSMTTPSAPSAAPNQFAMPSQPAAGASAFPTTPTSVGAIPTTGYTPVGPSSTAALPATTTNNFSAAPTATGFRPGSTQRATGYDFSGSNGATNTASGTSSPGYQLPPSTISR